MRTVLTIALGLLFAGAGFADDKPVNTVCPKSGKEADGSKVATVKDDAGNEVKIAACCKKCKGAIEADPGKYIEAAKKNEKAEE